MTRKIINFLANISLLFLSLALILSVLFHNLLFAIFNFEEPFFFFASLLIILIFPIIFVIKIAKLVLKWHYGDFNKR